MKKKKGTVVDIVSVLIAVISIFIVMLLFIYIIQVVDVKKNADQLARKYILEMETIGYLPSSSYIQLLQELDALGITDVDLTGTSFSQAGYGNPIYLSIKGNIKTKGLNTSGGDVFAFYFADVVFSFSINKMSTAKN